MVGCAPPSDDRNRCRPRRPSRRTQIVAHNRIVSREIVHLQSGIMQISSRTACHGFITSRLVRAVFGRNAQIHKGHRRSSARRRIHVHGPRTTIYFLPQAGGVGNPSKHIQGADTQDCSDTNFANSLMSHKGDPHENICGHARTTFLVRRVCRITVYIVCALGVIAKTCRNVRPFDTHAWVPRCIRGTRARPDVLLAHPCTMTPRVRNSEHP